MQRLLYNTARNIARRHRETKRRTVGASAASTAGDAVRKQSVEDNEDEATVVYDSKRPERGTLVRQLAVLGKNSNAYERSKVLMEGGITLPEFRDDLQRMMNIWLQSPKDKTAKNKVEELLVLMEGTQEDGPWHDLVEQWKPYLKRLPANYA